MCCVDCVDGRLRGGYEVAAVTVGLGFHNHELLVPSNLTEYTTVEWRARNQIDSKYWQKRLPEADEKSKHAYDRRVRLQIWDTQGMERYTQMLGRIYYRMANAMILMINGDPSPHATNPCNLKSCSENVRHFHENCVSVGGQQHSKSGYSEDAFVLVVINKCDLRSVDGPGSEQRFDTLVDRVRRWAADEERIYTDKPHSFILPVVVASAKTNLNVSAAARQIAEVCLMRAEARARATRPPIIYSKPLTAGGLNSIPACTIQ